MLLPRVALVAAHRPPRWVRKLYVRQVRRGIAREQERADRRPDDEGDRVRRRRREPQRRRSSPCRDGGCPPDGNRDLVFTRDGRRPRRRALPRDRRTTKGEPHYGFRADTINGHEEIPAELGSVVDVGRLTVWIGGGREGQIHQPRRAARSAGLDAGIARAQALRPNTGNLEAGKPPPALRARPRRTARPGPDRPILRRPKSLGSDVAESSSRLPAHDDSRLERRLAAAVREPGPDEAAWPTRGWSWDPRLLCVTSSFTTEQEPASAKGDADRAPERMEPARRSCARRSSSATSSSAPAASDRASSCCRPGRSTACSSTVSGGRGATRETVSLRVGLADVDPNREPCVRFRDVFGVTL